MSGLGDSRFFGLLERRDFIIMVFSGLILASGLIFEFLFKEHLVSTALFLLVSAISGYRIILHGFLSFLKGKFSIDLLMTVAAVGAFLSGHGEEGAAVLLLFFIAESLEEGAVEKTKRSVEALVKLTPETATVKKNGAEVEVRVEDIIVDDVVIVRPGGKIPLDGVIVRGSSSVDQSSITGESMPALKNLGDEVYAGSINNEGFIEIRVTKRSGETVLSKIIKMVEEAQSKKSRTESFVDRFATYYTPSVLVLAVLVATVPTFVFNLPLSEWGYRALILLVLSCPCALAISTPITILSGITNATKHGILVKGGTYVEDVGKVKVVAFDKTGTLTIGSPKVTDVVPIKNPGERLLSIAASIEDMSQHPIARAIVEYGVTQGVSLVGVDNFESISGKGVRGDIDGVTYFIGSVGLFQELGTEIPEQEVARLRKEGKTVILAGIEKRVIGVLGVMDEVREESKEAIEHLSVHGVKTVMLTGDNETVARAIAGRLGVDEYYADLLPEDKVRMVGELQVKYGSVVMIGDGVNDAPALAEANVGVAMGAVGSDVALETSDVALMQDDLSKVPYLVDLSIKTVRRMKENILASILVKGIFTALAFPGLTSLWLAVAVGDMGLSLAVILNAMRITALKPSTLCQKAESITTETIAVQTTRVH